jgi:hypothetical protein
MKVIWADDALLDIERHAGYVRAAFAEMIEACRGDVFAFQSE